RECFGDLETVEQRDVNPEVLALKRKAEGKLPEIFLACGTEDFLLENNRQMHKFLTDERIPHQYYESKGGHDMVFWHEYIVKAVQWMFG
ncbi:MAG: esterase, partial [Clostridia bacterium]|nr:esterase [Clostridia bacterium]